MPGRTVPSEDPISPVRAWRGCRNTPSVGPGGPGEGVLTSTQSSGHAGAVSLCPAKASAGGHKDVPVEMSHHEGR